MCRCTEESEGSCAHVLNLVLVDCDKNVSQAAKFLALLVSLYVFISSTKAHVLFIHKQSELHPTQPKRGLQRLSDTRWACSYSAVDTMCHTFYALLATLVEIMDGNDHGKEVEAKGLLLQVKYFSFLLFVIILNESSLALRDCLIFYKASTVT